MSIAFLAVQSRAQTKTPTRDSMKLREEKALEALRSRPHRIRLTFETRNTEVEEWRPYSCFILEYSSDRSYQRRCAEPLREKIRIGKNWYSKLNDGAWQLDKKVVTRGTVKYLPGTEVDIQKLDQSDAPNGGSAGFGIESHSRTLNLVDGLVYEHNGTGSVWFDDHGRFVMREAITFIHNPSPGRYSRRVEVYEYDDNIRIDIPVATEK
ncbi:MAG: hypothetical protein IPM25_05675 [Chloracidobacterium sp.]|nr:hypothetical protein [Chloracidobacterium sp.]